MHVVFYTDGSCSPNPGFGGFGIFGYTFLVGNKNRCFKHPVYSKCYFTRDGILENRDKDNIEVLQIVEHIEYLDGNNKTNNEAELKAILEALKKSIMLEDIESITIFTDSNYIVSAYNNMLSKWQTNNWKKVNGDTISHKDIWVNISEYLNRIKELNIPIDIKWVKGHSKRFGNNVADLYAGVASNTSKKGLNYPNVILNRIIPFKDYKESYLNKDFIYHYRDLFFSSDKVKDETYCFISSTEDPDISGRRNVSSIFTLNVGYIPKPIQRLRELYRNLDRNYVTTCTMKLSKFNDKEFLRLCEIVDPEQLVYESSNKVFSTIGDLSPFIVENISKKPFAIHIYESFTKLLDLHFQNTDNSIRKLNITDLVIKDSKLTISNSDKYIDYSNVIDGSSFYQKVILRVGYDIPSYLSLKKIEDSIKNVYIIISETQDSSFVTLYSCIETNNRTIYSLNIENKFLRKVKKIDK